MSNAGPSPPPPNPLASAGIDRLADRRRDAEWLAATLRDPATRFVPVWQLRNLLDGGDPPRPRFLSADELGSGLLAGATPVLLGEHQGAAVFALDVEQGDAERLPGEFVELRRVAALLPPREAALLAHARAMVYWHSRHRFCGNCGTPTTSAEAGHVRACGASGCAAHHFPRTDPAIIVLVTHSDRCLLGRQAAWDPGRYATLAGFVEPGESLEDAVAREVWEEAGVRVASCRYHSSQPWPFPASLMLGFTATAESDEIRIDPSELEDARWFSREELREGVATGGLSLPPPVSIAHALIVGWLSSDR